MSGRAFSGLLRRDLLLAMRGPAELALPLLFYVLVATLVPLAVSPDAATLAGLAPGIIWVGALLATLLSLDRLFRSDFDDGTLDLMLLSPAPLPLLVLAKVLAHWLVTGLPLLLVSPLLGAVPVAAGRAHGHPAVSLLLGTPVLSLVGAVGVALTVRRAPGRRAAGAAGAAAVRTGADLRRQRRGGGRRRPAGHRPALHARRVPGPRREPRADRCRQRSSHHRKLTGSGRGLFERGALRRSKDSRRLCAVTPTAIARTES